MTNNPWGNSGNSGGGNTPNNVEEIFKYINRETKKATGGGRPPKKKKSGGGGREFSLYRLLLIGLVLWLASGIYKVDSGERGVVMRFGAYHRTESPNIHYSLPYPIEQVEIVAVEKKNSEVFGLETPSSSSQLNPFQRSNRTYVRKLQGEKSISMLTEDRNIILVPFSVNWRIKDAYKYLFEVRDHRETIRAVAESAMREVVAQNRFSIIFAEDKQSIATSAERILQEILDEYNTGVEVIQLNLGNVGAPKEVNKAITDVEDAKQDRDKLIEQAIAYQNEVIPQARGQAEQLVQEANGYKARKIAIATGEANRFEALLKEYVQNKQITKDRIYLEVMEDVLGGIDKVIIDDSVSGNVLPYLPIGGNK